jgi:hypothetical protein
MSAATRARPRSAEGAQQGRAAGVRAVDGESLSGWAEAAGKRPEREGVLLNSKLMEDSLA